MGLCASKTASKSTSKPFDVTVPNDTRMEEKKAAEEAEYAAKKEAEDAGKYLVTDSFPSVIAHLKLCVISSAAPPVNRRQ